MRKRTRRASFYKAKHRDRCFFNVVGESRYSRQIRALTKAGRKHTQRYDGWDKLGIHFWLVPEPNNPYDPNAIGVWAGPAKRFDRDRALQVGYIPREKAKVMAGRIQKPLQVDGILVGKADNWGAKLDEGPLAKLLK